MNNKGFTLVELLATIIVLGIVAGFTGITISNTVKNAKEKAEEVFVDNLTDGVEVYLKTDGSKLSYSDAGCIEKTLISCEGAASGVECSNTNALTKVKLYKAESTFANIINSSYSTIDKFENPNDGTLCSTSTKVTLYRDTDYVYYYSFNKEDLNCLSTSGVVSNLPEIVECN